MPKIVRSMRKDAGKPALGPRDLGVRVPPDPFADVSLDAAGDVQPGTGGMSVAPDLRDLPARLIPRRLRHLLPAAAGNDNRFIWALGEGAFIAERAAAGLILRPDPARAGHGFVEPDEAMKLAVYIDALEKTCDSWTIDEV